jgi:hypothetical protein
LCESSHTKHHEGESHSHNKHEYKNAVYSDTSSIKDAVAKRITGYKKNLDDLKESKRISGRSQGC